MNHLLILVVQKISLMLLVNFLPMSKISHFIYISVVVIRIGQEVATEMKRSMLEFSPETGDGIVVFTNSEYVDIREFVQAIRKSLSGTPERR